MVNILTKGGGYVVYISSCGRHPWRRQKEPERTKPSMRLHLRRARGTWYRREVELPGVLDEYIKAYESGHKRSENRAEGRGKVIVSELVDRVNNGDSKARKQLFEHYFYLVVENARHFEKLGFDFNDAVQAGSEGLIHELNIRDIKSYQLSARAEKTIMRYISKNKSDTEGAELLSIEVLERRVELEDPVFMLLVPVILNEHYDRIFTELTDLQQKVIRMRFFEGKTLEQIGKKVNLTGERVRQIETVALSILRQPAVNRKIRSFLYEEI